jgi:hypothetical protein
MLPLTAAATPNSSSVATSAATNLNLSALSARMEGARLASIAATAQGMNADRARFK